MARKYVIKQHQDRQDPELMAAFARRLQALRRALGYQHGVKILGRVEMAALLGVEHERYSRWERGEVQPPLHVLSNIRRLTGVSLDQLVAGVECGRDDLIPSDGLPEFALSLGDRLQMVRLLIEPEPDGAASLMKVALELWKRWEASAEQPPVAKMVEFARRAGVTLDFLYTGDLSGLSYPMTTELLARHPELGGAHPKFPLRPQPEHQHPGNHNGNHHATTKNQGSTN